MDATRTVDRRTAASSDLDRPGAGRHRRSLLRSGVGGAAAGLAGVLQAACGRFESAARPPAALAPARLSTFVSGSQDSYRLLQEKQFPAFTQAHPGVTVELTQGLLDLDKLRILAAGGTTPDLYMAGASYAPVIADGKYAVPLDDRLKTWDKLSDFFMPAGAKIRPVSPNFSDWIAVGSLSKAQDQAWELAKFLLEPEQLLAYSESRYSQPPRKSISAQGFMKQPLLQRMAEVFDKYGQAQIRVPDTPRFQEVLRNVGEDLFAGKSSSRQAVEEAARLLQVEVDKTGAKWTTL